MTAQFPVFLYGTLCDPELLEIVAGEVVEQTPATFADHRVFWAKDQSFPIVTKGSDKPAHGLLISVSAAAKARLDFYEIGFGYYLHACSVNAASTAHPAEIYLPEDGRWTAGAPWSLSDWQQEYGTLAREAARDYMRLFGLKAPQEAAALFGQVRGRAASRLRARHQPSPMAFQPAQTRANVTTHTSNRPLQDFFDVVEETLQFQTFAGSPSAKVQRISLIGGDAVTVLPYDPANDTVLVIRQFRHGAFSRGDENPWCVEPAAGRIDPFETPEEAALRELREETGVIARDLHRIASYYPTPAAVSEHLTSYVATCDLGGADGRIGGLSGENEDIMSHVIPFNSLMEMVHSGAANTGPLVMSALWLQNERHRLR
ncbi:MAG: NUDIX domain-containing protein [Boseongicola sp.]|nr:NUDIX domain-containing protein [Boseongicola sp.]